MAQIVDPPPTAVAAGTAHTGATAPGWAPKPLGSRIFVRCYRTYRDAERAYDRLRFLGNIPERRMMVVARGLSWREPLGNRGMLKLVPALAAVVGAAVGLILWALGFTGGAGWLGELVLGAVFGGGAGALGALLLAFARSKRRGIVTTGHVEPSEFDILVEEELAPQARDLLVQAEEKR